MLVLTSTVSHGAKGGGSLAFVRLVPQRRAARARVLPLQLPSRMRFANLQVRTFPWQDAMTSGRRGR